MMRALMALLAGLLFGLGLYLSGMADPMKVLGFLELAGNWDPSLGVVMAGALAISSGPFYLAMRRTRSVLGAPMQMPTATAIDRRLVLGSVVFGAGWAVAGLCPGPALALLLTGRWEPVLFTVAMIAGMLLFDRLSARAAH